MTRGFLLGKFLPPHNGHVLLCDFARNFAGELTILVCTLDRDPIPGDLRAQWMRELFPDCRVCHLTDDVPQEPSEHPQFWAIWQDICRRFHPEPIDFVFASESYGHRLAAELGAQFVPVDPMRLATGASGRAIRENPFAHWHLLPAAVRPYYAGRVSIVGPESTGKTTLAGILARHFQTIAVPEYGRIHTDQFGVDCSDSDISRIAQGHIALTKAAARQANRLLILDTDPVLTAVWSDMLLGRRDPWFETFKDTADLYLLCDVDVPWVDDGTRYFRDAETRGRFMAACRRELEVRGLAHAIISGGWDQRLARAINAIEERFPRIGD